MNCQDTINQYMHEFLDEDILPEHEKELREHLLHCPACQNEFRELKKAIALVQSTSHIQAPDGFSSDVMAKLPKEKKKVELKRWFRHHPLLTAASLFIVLMMGSLISTWNQDEQFSVSKQPNLVVQNGTVIIPRGQVVTGDVVVRNGTVKVEGELQGNLTVINGENYMASAGNVTGEIQEINEVFEWIWYHIKNAMNNLIGVIGNNEKEQSLLEVAAF
ncbi:anti-sigma factor family protein [Mesobacillus harenae]|uniref:anti-sigma factor family protein n=1 Tax=Mesobacillus harenae TaxID=2213203 RepID=UPI00241128A9|nr:anti-sigma factor [Mesobacillus harenae]